MFFSNLIENINSNVVFKLINNIIFSKINKQRFIALFQFKIQTNYSKTIPERKVYILKTQKNHIIFQMKSSYE